MNKILVWALGMGLFCHIYGTAQTQKSDQPTQQSSGQNPETQSKPVQLVGYVRDAFCLLKNPQAGAADDTESRKCMRQCIQGGSPLVILGNDGTLYLPIAAGDAPDKDERSRLLPYSGRTVRVTGWIFERGGMHSIAIDKIDALAAKSTK
jgi:hypothetical protein